MNTRDRVEEIARKKALEKSRKQLIKDANEDIDGLVKAILVKGFGMGMKVGFVVGAFITLFIVLLFK